MNADSLFHDACTRLGGTYRRRVGVLLILLSSIGVAGCHSSHEARSDTTSAANSSSVISERSIWANPSIFDMCYQLDEVDRPIGCMTDALYRAGASDEVISAMEQISAGGDPGYVSAYRKVGSVGIATVTHPFRANTNDEVDLIASDGNIIDVDDNQLSTQEMNSAPYASLLNQHPGLAPFPPADLTRTDQNVDGSIAFRFDTAMRDCHACKSEGWLSIEYRFDSQGRFIGHKLIGIEKTEGGI